MKQRRLCFLLTATAFTISAWICLGAVTLCNQCGYENTDSVAVCSHCGAVVASTPVPAPEPDAGITKPAPRIPASYIPQTAVTSELALARSCMSNEAHELAALYLKNARALEQLVDPAAPSTAGLATNILALIRLCDARIMQGKANCPVCEGSGKRQMVASGVGSGSTSRYSSALPCPHCGGDGTVVCVRATDELLLAVNKARAQYRDLQTARKYASIGNAWLPGDLPARLDLRQMITLKRATASPCPSCAGLGRAACGTCHGSGMGLCPAACDRGLVKNDSGHLGAASSVCTACGGDGFVDCKSCIGRGAMICRECTGSGELTLCKKCDGQGCTPCRHCQGTGQQDGKACPSCIGQGITECASCLGSGRKR